MSKRSQHEFPGVEWQIVPPPIGPDGMQDYARLARQARAEVTAHALHTAAAWIGAGARRLAAGLRTFLCYAGAGAAKRAPDLPAGCR